MPRDLKTLGREVLDLAFEYWKASDGAVEGHVDSETNVHLSCARMKIAAKVYGRARDEVERAERREAPTLTSRHRELAAMTGGEPEDEGA